MQDDRPHEDGGAGASRQPSVEVPETENDPRDYRFDPTQTAASAALWDDAHRGARDEWDATEALAREAPRHGWTRDTPLVRELILTAAYRLEAAGSSEAVGAALLPQHDPPDGPCYPPKFRDRSAGALALLDAVAASAGEPAALARANDFLFEARHGNGRDRAERAAAAYRAVAAPAAVIGGDPDDARDLAMRSLLPAWTPPSSQG